MRSFVAFIAGVVALGALLVAIPLTWVATHVADEAGYVDFTTSMIDDEEVQSSLGEAVATEVVTQSGAPAALEPVIATALTGTIATVSDNKAFREAWQLTQRRSHRHVFGSDADADRLSIDLGPVAKFLVERTVSQLPIEVAVPDEFIVPINNTSEVDVIAEVDATTERSRIAIIVAAGAALLVLLVARRRGVALMWLGIGIAVVAGALALTGMFATPEILNRSDAPTALARTLQQVLADQATASIGEWLKWIAASGGAVAAVGFAARVLGRSSR